MYKLKDVVKRGSALLGAVGLLAGVGASAMPAFVSADALNPLTERSLTLSSSSPGWAYTDGSGNRTYSYPGSGADGKETGNTFSFRVSSTANVHAFTFQYCTKSAGECTAPGNNDPVTHANDDTTDAAHTSDLDIVTGTDQSGSGGDNGAPALISSSNWSAIKDSNESDFATTGRHAQSPKLDNSEGNFIVLTAPHNAAINADTGQPTWQYPQSGGADLTDWQMTATNQEESTVAPTGMHNMITLTSTAGLDLHAGDYVKVIFFATNDNYITNPGQGSFFVKINSYSDAAYQNWEDNFPNDHDGADDYPNDVIDGGVTVANVMNESIAIQTKVLETMDFSVGTVDPDTLTPAQLSTATGGKITGHGTCDPIQKALTPTAAQNVLLLGDAEAENSLDTNHTYATHSYFRLSSNSSNGATVYYAGTTLSNTEGDTIAPIGLASTAPSNGSEQFGLALDNTDGTGGNATYPVNYATASPIDSVAMESGADTAASITGLDSVGSGGGTGSWTAYKAAHPTGVHNPQLYPLVPYSNSDTGTNYDGGTGGINGADTAALDGGSADGVTTKFTFDPNSNTVPAPLATEDDQVVDCVTGKVRYIANIAATTPAGIYTTKINYVAAPQY